MKKEIFIVSSTHFYDGEIDTQIFNNFNGMSDAIALMHNEYDSTMKSMQDRYGVDELTLDDIEDDYTNWHKITSPDCKEIYQIELLSITIDVDVTIKIID